MKSIDKSRQALFLELLKYKKENEELKIAYQKDIAERGQTEEELREKEKKYRLLVESANEAIVVVQDGMLKLTNPMTTKMTGYSKEEIEIMPFPLFIHPLDRQQLVDNHQRRLQGEDVQHYYVFRLLNKDGSTRWVYMNAVLIDWEGKPATLNFLNDITERKLAEEALELSNKKMEAIISASPDGIGIISLDGKMQFISDKLAEMNGYTNEEKSEIIGKHVFSFIDPSNHEMLKDNIRKLLAGESDKQLTEYIAIRKDKSRHYIDVNATVLPDSNGNPASILFIERDITERKRVEEEIIQKNLKLAELIATKDKFFSIIAHELKSPFQGLLGYSHILSTEYITLSEEEKISFIGRIDELSHSSYKLLENLLEWSRMQTGQMIFNAEDFNLLVVLYPTLSLVKQIAQNKDIEFKYLIDNSIFINADKNMLTTIIRNLISNSIKFTIPGGKIKLAVVKMDNLVKISVTDTGIGIDKEGLDNLFQIDKSISKKGTSNERGTGLGLLICKEMIKKHRGKISVESEVGKGSTFSFTIPSSL
jgi:PAS domain S-box-containing protein